MKTNLLDLMSKVSELNKEFQALYYDLRSNNKNIKIIELDKTEQILEDHSDFNEKLKDFFYLGEEIARLQGIIYEKNNEFKTQNNQTINMILMSLRSKRQELNLLDTLVRQNNLKERTSETNNSYFTSYELVYDKEQMQQKKLALQQEIQDLELELSQLNSKLFEIN